MREKMRGEEKERGDNRKKGRRGEKKGVFGGVHESAVS